MRSKRFFLTSLAAVALIAIAGDGVGQATPSSGVTNTTRRIDQPPPAGCPS